jgi:hypothetical protein
VILIDSNVPMYVVGAQHRHKDDALRVLDDLIARGERLVTDVEALQEILHRYSAIDRPDAIQPAFDAMLNIIDEVFPVDLDHVQEAKTILLGRYGVSARDALHVAVMRAHGIERIVSFDTAFDRIPGIERLS